MPLILRAVKGSKLSILEMDGNLTYLSSTLSGSIIQLTGSSIDASNTSITASTFIGNGSQLTFVTASFVTASNVFGPHGANSILSSSYAISASRAVSSSFALTASWSPTPNLESVLTVGSNLEIYDYEDNVISSTDIYPADLILIYSHNDTDIYAFGYDDSFIYPFYFYKLDITGLTFNKVNSDTLFEKSDSQWSKLIKKIISI